jgi:hypothetical protein
MRSPRGQIVILTALFYVDVMGVIGRLIRPHESF